MDTSDDPILTPIAMTMAAGVGTGMLASKAMQGDASKYSPVKPEDINQSAQAMLKDEEAKKGKRFMASVDTSNWLQPMLSRPGLLGM